MALSSHGSYFVGPECLELFCYQRGNALTGLSGKRSPSQPSLNQASTEPQKGRYVITLCLCRSKTREKCASWVDSWPAKIGQFGRQLPERSKISENLIPSKNSCIPYWIKTIENFCVSSIYSQIAKTKDNRGTKTIAPTPIWRLPNTRVIAKDTNAKR